MNATAVSPKVMWLIDDDETTCYINNRLMEKYFNMNVTCYTNPLDALDAIKENISTNLLPDVILLDIKMPIMNGFELLELCHAKGIGLENTNIFMLTSSSLLKDKEKAMALPIRVKGFITKPLTPEKVEQILSTIPS